MGDAQSAQREGKKDEAAEEESGKVDDAQAEQFTEDKPFKNSVQISEISEKAGISIAEVNGLCEDEVAADAVLSPDEAISETEIPLEEEEEAPKDDERNEKESSNEVCVAEDLPLEMTEIDGKKNDINDGFRKFLSNIGLRLSIKRGSTDLLKDLPDETNNKEQCDEEPLEAVVKETEIENPEQNNDANTARGTHDNDSTTGPTMTDLTPEDVLENAEEKATEAKEEAGSDDAGDQMPPEVEEADREAGPEDELQESPEQGEVVSPIKKFFTTGIFSGLRKKRKPAEEETNEKEMIDMGKKDSMEVTEGAEENQQLDKEQIDPGVEASADETEHKENEHKQEILSTTSPETTDEGKSSTTDPSTDIVPEPETLNAREKEKVPASPLKRLLSGSSFRKLSKKPRSRRSSDSRLSDSGEHAADQLMSSTELAENQKEEGPTQPPSEAPEEEDSAWASFKKLLTPKKRRRAPLLINKDTETPAAADKPKPSEGEQISDQSTDEDKKRKDSSVSWEAVLCGSGKKRSRKTSDSEDETPPNDNDNKQDVSSKPSEGQLQESSSQRKNSLVSPTRVCSDGEGPTTWITFRRLVTPKRKAKEEDENKDNVQSDSEVSQEESSFSIKKLLPGRKKRKSTEKQDHVSSDEADKDVPSGDEDSETPAVVPLSEFDTPESMIQIQTQAEIESHLLKESDYEVPEDLHQAPEPVLPCEGVQNEGKALEESESENQVTATPAKDEKVDDDSEVISKHQQLSDITEEGIITETMATPASVNEEAGRDDTIAEDLMEMTSEAITAPEPASVTTLADETEMISALSQLSTESSKTSGNATPVPAEYEVMETDALLQQVVETITTTPEAIPISTSNTKSENIVSSVLHQIFKTFIKEDKETPVLEIHTRPEATSITSGEAFEELDEVNKLATTAQSESISEVDDSKPTEFLPEAFEKFKTAEVTMGEVHEVHPAHLELNESEASAEHVSEETTPGESSIVEAPQAKTENQKMGAASLELNQETEPQNEVQVKSEKVDELEKDADEAEQALVPDVPISAVASKLDSDEESEQLPEQEVISEDILTAETMTDETEERADSFDLPFKVTESDATQDSEILPSNVKDTLIETNAEDDIFMDAREITQSVDEGSVSLSLAEGTIDQVDAFKTEDLAPSTEGSLEPMDSFTAEPEEVQTEQTGLFNTEEPQQEMEISNEQENKKPPEDTAEDEQAKEPEKLEAVQAPVVYLEDNSVQSLPGEVKLEDVPVTDGLKEESIDLTEGSFEPLDASKSEHIQEPEVLDTVQASPDSSMDNLTLAEKERPEDRPLSESVIDEGKQETKASLQRDDLQELKELLSDVVDTGIETSTEDFFASVDEGSVSLPTSEATLEQVDAPKTEDEQEKEEKLQTLQRPPKDSQISNLLTLIKVITQGIPAATVTDEPQEKTEVRVGAQEKTQDGGFLTENVEGAEVLTTEVDETAKDLSLDEPVVTERVEEDTAAVPSTEESLEPMESFTPEQVKEPKELQTVQTSLFNTGEPQKEVELVNEDVEIVKVQEPELLPSVAKDVAEETLIEKEEAVPTPEVKESIEEIRGTVFPTGGSLEPMDLSTTDVQKQEGPQTVQASPLDLEADSVLPLRKIAEDIPAGETIVEDLQKEAEVRADAPEKIEVEANTTDSVQEPNDLPSTERDFVQETVCEEGATVLVTEATDSTEEQKVPTTPTEPSPEPVSVSKTEDAQEEEVLNTADGSLLDSEEGSLPLLEKETEVITVKDESQKETEAGGKEPEVSPPDVEDTVKELRDEPLEQPQIENDKEVLQSVEEDTVEETLMGKDASTPVLEAKESIDVDRETIPVTGGSPESVDLSTTEKIQVQEEPEPVKTVEESPFDSEVCSLPLSRLKTEDIAALTTTTNENVLSEDIPAAETVTDKPREETEVTAEPDRGLPSEDITADFVQEQEEIPSSVKDIDLDTSAEEGETTQEPVLTKSTDEIIPEDKPAVEIITDEPQKETDVRIEPQDIPVALETTIDELKPTTQVRVEADTTELIQEPEEQPSTLEDIDQKTLNEGDTTQAAAVESIDGGSAIVPFAEQSHERVCVERTEDKQEPEEVNVEQVAESYPKASGLQPFEDLLSEDIPTAETVTDEPQEEAEVMAEPDRDLPSEAITNECVTTQVRAEADTTELIQEPEEQPSTLEDIDQETFNEGDTTQAAAAENIDSGSAIVPFAEQSHERVCVERTEDKPEPEQVNVEQVAESYPKASGLQPFEDLLSEDIPTAETVTDEPQEEAEVMPEPDRDLPSEAITNECVKEQEEIPSTVKDIDLDTSAEEVATIQEPVLTESTDEVIQEDKPAVEIITDEPTEIRDASIEPRDMHQFADTSGTEQEIQSDPKANCLAFENVICQDVSTVESVPHEPEKDIKEPIEPVEELQAGAFESEIQELDELPSDVGDLERETPSVIECDAEVPVPEESLHLVDALKTEQVQVQDEIPAVGDSSLDSKVENLQPLEEKLPEDKPTADIVIEEPQKEIYVSIEPQDQQSVQTETYEKGRESDALPFSVKDIIQEALTKEGETIHIPDAGDGKDGGKTTTFPAEESPETVDISESEDVQEQKVFITTQRLLLDSEMGSLLTLEKVVSEDISAVETVMDEPQEEIKVRDEESEMLPSGVEDTMKNTLTEEGVSFDVDVVPEGPKPGSKQMPVSESRPDSGGAQIPLPDGSLEPQTERMSSEDIQTVETSTDELVQEAEVRAEPLKEQPFEVAQTKDDLEAEVLLSDGKDNVKETNISVSGEHVAEILDEQIQEDVSRPDLDNVVAAIADHIEGDPHLDQAASESLKTESNLQGTQAEQKDWTPEVAKELGTTPQGHVASSDEESNITQVLESTIISEETQAPRVDDAEITDKSKHEVSLSAVQVAIEGEKESEDPRTETAALEHAIVQEVVTCYIKEVSATIPDVLPEKTSDSIEPALDSNDFAEAAEQDSVADINIKPMETVLGDMPEVEVTEIKEVIEVHHETVKEKDILSAPHDTEEGVTQEETQTTTEEVVHVKGNLLEIASESAVVIVEQAVKAQPDAVSKEYKLSASQSDEKEHQEVMGDGCGTLKERQDEAPVDISEDSTTPQQVSGIVEQTLMLEETEAEEVKPATVVTAGDVKPLSEEPDVKEVHEPEQSTQSAQGQDRVEPVKQKDVSGVGVQAEVPLKPTEPTTPMQQAENEKNVDLAVVKDQPIDTAGSISNLASTARAVITTHPVQRNLGILITERAEPGIEMDVSEINVQAVESVEPEIQRAKSQKQTDITEVQEQLTEISEPVLLQDSTEEAVTKPELLDVATHAVEPVELKSKASAALPPDEGTDKLLEQLDASNGGFDSGELKRAIHLPQEAEGQIQTEQHDVSDQPTEITESEATLELTERAVVTTQPELMDDGTCVSKTEEPVTEENGSKQLQNEETEQLTSTDVLEVVKPENVSQGAESQTEPTEVKVHQTEITEQVTHYNKEARAVIISQPVLWDFTLRTTKTTEPGPKEPVSPLQISAMDGALMEDVSKDEAVESDDQITQIAEGQTELTEPDDQAAEITKPEQPLGSERGVVIMTHPMLLDIGLQESEVVEPVAVAPSAPPPITEEIEPLSTVEVLEVGDKDGEAVEAAEPTDQTQGAERQIEPVVVDVQPAEITDPLSPSDSTEGALTVTQPVLLEVSFHENETLELESKASASPSAIMENAEALTPTEISNIGVEAVKVEEPITPTQTADEQTDIELPEDDALETKITEPEKHESKPEITDGALVTTHPMLLDVGVHTTETVDPVANGPDSPTVTAEEMEALKQMDVLRSDIQPEEEGLTQEAESQKEPEEPETSLQAKPEVHFDLTQIAVITTQPIVLDDSLYTIKTVELELEEAENKEINPLEKVTSSIQPTETNQPVCQTEKEEVFLSEPLPSETCDQETKAKKEHVHKEEENDQDVWLDAEEGDYTQEETETTFLDVEEHLESMAESMPEEEERFEEEVEIDPNVQIEEEESQQKEYKTGEVCDIESEGEGEDFAIALEHQEFATASITTIEWD